MIREEKKDFICTDADNGRIYMEVTPNGTDELMLDIYEPENGGGITLSKYDAIDLANFILNKFS